MEVSPVLKLDRFPVLLLAMILLAVITPLGEASDVFSIETLDVDGKTYTIIWVGLGRPDLTIRYCGLNYIYYRPVIEYTFKVVDGELRTPYEEVVGKVSRYVGPPEWYRENEAGMIGLLNYERFLIADKIEEAFEKAGARRHGWTGQLNFVYYHEWDPKVLGVYVYLGGVEAGKDAKVNRVKGLIRSVSKVLEEWNVTHIMVWETYSNVPGDKVIEASVRLGDVLVEGAYSGRAPEAIRRILSEGWVAGASSALSIDISLVSKPPSLEEIVFFVKWLRDKVGYCEVPLVVEFSYPRMEIEDLALRVSEVSEPTQSGKAPGYNYDVLTHDLKQSVQRSQIISPLTLAIAVLLVVVTTLVMLSFKVIRWNR
jgi:hypothetical protein